MNIEEFYNPSLALAFIFHSFLVLNVIRNLEYLMIHREFNADGLYNPTLLQTRPNTFANRLSMVIIRRLTKNMILCILVFSSIAAVALFYLDDGPVKKLLMILLSIGNFSIALIDVLGKDGADTVFNITNVCLLLTYVILPDVSFQKMVLYFISAQICLAYFTAGAFKLTSKPWHTGEGLKNMVSAQTFGNPRLSRNLQSLSPHTFKILGWFVIVWQVSFPVILLVGPKQVLIPLMVGIAFHLFNALFFRLTRFLFAFVGAYPAIIFTAHELYLLLN